MKPKDIPVLTNKEKARFNAHVDAHIGQSSCWPWTGSQWNTGYGRFFVQSNTYGAHRVAWVQENGSIPQGLCCLHRCDNPSCCNPAHLFLGTYIDNNADKQAKGRQTKGSEHPQAKLTEDDVKAIRTQATLGGCTKRGLAAKYGVSLHLIKYIVRRKMWTHV